MLRVLSNGFFCPLGQELTTQAAVTDGDKWYGMPFGERMEFTFYKYVERRNCRFVVVFYTERGELWCCVSVDGVETIRRPIEFNAVANKSVTLLDIPGVSRIDAMPYSSNAIPTAELLIKTCKSYETSDSKLTRVFTIRQSKQ